MKKNILLIFIVLFISSCSKNEEINEKDTTKVVFATYPKSKDSNVNRVLNGTAVSENETKLSFKVQGNVTYLKVKLGDEVKKAQLVAKLDSKPYELRVSQIKYALSEADAALQNAKSTYERVKKLYVNQNSSISDMDKARAAYNASKAKVKNIKKELEYAKLQLSYTKLYSSMNGYISYKYIQENENIAVGTPVVLISDKLIDEVSIQIPENIINRVKKYSSVKVVFPSLEENLTFEGTVQEVSKYSSPKTKTYKVIVKIKDSSNLIKSGMSADIYFNFSLDSNSNVYYVPSNSILNNKQEYFLYLLEKLDEENYKVKKVQVKVGELTSKGYEVLRGIKPNDLILKAGMSEVYENMKVQIGNKKDLGN